MSVISKVLNPIQNKENIICNDSIPMIVIKPMSVVFINEYGKDKGTRNPKGININVLRITFVMAPP